ncbi:MAG TPA: HK97 family phage prohead protease [Bacteroidales bacterium]|nr:HK97 family phage prohead protease [Bacteroidales bacterium]
MTSRIEKRYASTPDFLIKNKEFRTQIVRVSGETSQQESRTIRGYGAVFNQKSKIITEWISDKGEWRTFFEIIESTAFDKLIASNWGGFDVVLDVNHRTDEILARLASGTLRITKDERGLMYEAEMPRTARGEDVLRMIERGDYYQSSFQFTIAEGGERWEHDPATGLYTRYITEVELLIDECVATWFGAYDNTDVQIVRTINDGSENFNVYIESDIAVAKERLNRIMSETTEQPDYRIELEKDRDTLKMFGIIS